MARRKKAGPASKLVTRSRSTRTTKDGMYVAVNVYVHRELLDQLDGEAADEDRTRRAQLERVLCRAFDKDHKKLAKAEQEKTA
jgi:hypothetical protein